VPGGAGAYRFAAGVYQRRSGVTSVTRRVSGSPPASSHHGPASTRGAGAYPTVFSQSRKVSPTPLSGIWFAPPVPISLSSPVPLTTAASATQLARTSAAAKTSTVLRTFSSSLSHSAQTLGHSAERLSQSHKEQTESLSIQAASLQETQVTAQEIKQTSMVAAQKSDDVLRQAERAEQIGRSGESAIEQSLTGMHDIQKQVVDMAQSIRSLDERAQQIANITTTVKGLADRSNMLALNAAIEAVRSGEHGKGFGVVAREIRTLANQSIRSTEQVGTILDDITQAIRDTVARSEQGQAQVEAGLTQARTSGESLRALSAIVQDNMGAVRQIAVAVNQQNAGVSEIFGALTDLSTMMHATMESLMASQRVTQSLREVSEQMEQVARSYRV